MKHDIIMALARDAAGGMLSYDAEGFCSLTGPEIARFAELIVRQCGYYADVFESLGCPADMDPTDTKPSDYIKEHFGVEK
jgi:hypothetical protein